jgi:hypothetical protein
VHKVAKSSEEYTQAGALALEEIRRGMRFDKRMMARILGLPYRTYQDYSYGKRSVPERVLVAAKDAAKRDKDVMAQIIREVVMSIDRQFPQGIPSVNGEGCE